MMYGIAYDKERIESGKSTGNIQLITATLADIRQAMKENSE
jgi:hypothetical protein